MKDFHFVEEMVPSFSNGDPCFPNEATGFLNGVPCFLKRGSVYLARKLGTSFSILGWNSKSKNMASLIICPCFDIRHKKSRIDSFTVTLINRNFQPYFHSSPIQIFSIFIFIAIQPLMFKRYESRGRLCCG